MALVTIPTTSEYDFYEFTITLDGVVYGFLIKWNTRTGLWYFDLRNSDGETLASGIPMFPGLGLLSRFGRQDFPPGLLFVHHVDGIEPYAKEDLGDRLLLMYDEA